MKGNKERKFIDILNYISDYFIRLILVNILVIFTSLPVITIIPSLKAGFGIFSDFTFKDETPIFKSYFSNFAKSFKKSFLFSVIIVLILAITIFNNRLYSEMITQTPNLLYNVGYYITMVIIIGVVMITLYLPLVLYEKDNYNFKNTLKLAFFLAGKYFLRTIVLTLLLLIPYLMFATSFTTMLLIFIGASLPLLLSAYLLKKVRVYIREITVINDD